MTLSDSIPSESDEKYSFRWGIMILDAAAEGGLNVPGFMLHNFIKAGVTQEEFLTILLLAAKHYECEKGKSTPSLQFIANMMGLKTRRIMQIIQSLEEKGLLEVTRFAGARSEYSVQRFAEACLRLWEEDDTRAKNCTKPLQKSALLPLQKSAPKEEEVEEKQHKKNNNAPIGALLLTEAGLVYFQTWKRKKWANAEQRRAFEETEKAVGAATMIEAVKWAAVKGSSDVATICTAARNWGKKNGACAASRSTPAERRTRKGVIPEYDWAKEKAAAAARPPEVWDDAP